MRKFVVLLMCLILPFSLFAQGAAESGAADAEGKVIIFQSKVEITEALERAAEDFTAETGIEVEIWETTGDDYRAQLSLRLAGDEVPTIFTVAAGSEAEMFAPYIAPIEDSEVNQYISSSLALMVNGKSSGVPYSVEGYGLVINTDMVSEADLENDETFLAALDRLASEGVNPFGLSQESYFLIGHLLNAPSLRTLKPVTHILPIRKSSRLSHVSWTRSRKWQSIRLKSTTTGNAEISQREKPQ